MKRVKLILKREWQYELLLLPALVGYSIFFLYPVLCSFYYSVTDWSQFTRVVHFTGLKNYTRLFSDSEMIIGIKNTVVYAVIMTIFQNLFAIPLAVILNRNLKTKNILRMVFFAPAVLSSLVVGFLWSYIMSPTDYGLLNRLLGVIGISKINWLGNPHLALYSVILTQIWQWTGWAMVIYLANLQSISQDYYEAAKIDGANWWEIFKNITFPLLAPSVTINAVLSMIGSLKVFDIVYSMTGGGPGHATETITSTLIKKGFTEGQYGYGSAISVVFFLIIAFIALIMLGYLQKREEKLS